MKNVPFCSRSRKTRILTTGIHEVFRGLKFESDAEIGQKRTFFKGFNLSAEFLIYWFICAAFLSMPLGTSPPVICGGLAGLVWILSGKPLKLGRIVLGKSWFWPVLILIILPWIGLLYTPDPTGFGIKFAKKTHYWLYALVVATIPFARFSTERLIQAFFIGLAINALVAIFQFLGIFPILNEYSYGLGLGYGAMAAYLVLGILMSSYFFRETNDKRKWILYGLLMGIYFFHLIILRGRAGPFTFFLVSPLIIRNLFGKLNILRTIIVYEIIVGIMMLSPLVWDRIIWSVEQIEYHLDADPDSAWGKEFSMQENRLYMWRGAVQIFLENPVLGVGTGGYPVVYKEKGNPKWPYMAHPHNNFLYMGVSFGIIGILVLLWFFGEVFRNAWKEKETPLGYFVFSGTLVIFITGLVNSAIIDASTAFLLALVTGLQNGFPKFAKAVTPQVLKVQAGKNESPKSPAEEKQVSIDSTYGETSNRGS